MRYIWEKGRPRLAENILQMTVETWEVSRLFTRSIRGIYKPLSTSIRSLVRKTARLMLISRKSLAIGPSMVGAEEDADVTLTSRMLRSRSLRGGCVTLMAHCTSRRALVRLGRLSDGSKILSWVGPICTMEVPSITNGPSRLSYPRNSQRIAVQIVLL